METQTNPFLIKTSSYEGPFELVLELIESRKMLINELSLATITDEFIAHVKGHVAFPVELTSDFVGVAATLLLIKSKSLLPTLELTEGEEEDIESFKNRLTLYEKTREAAKELGRVFGQSVLVAPLKRDEEPMFSPSRDTNIEAILVSLDRVLSQIVEDEVLPEARVKSTVTIEEMMDRLIERVEKAMTLSFKTFSADAKERIDVIVSFLALLELVKDGKLDASQDETFKDITISSQIAGTPHYE